MGHAVQDPRDHAPADDQHQGHEGQDLADSDDEGAQDAAAQEAGRGLVGRRLAAQNAGQGGQQDQSQHHGQVLDDQPADRDLAASRLDQPPLLQRAQQHDGRGDRQGQAEDDPRADAPAQKDRQAQAHDGRGRDLNDRAGDGDVLHRHQVLERKVQADAEHQQDHADLRQLRRQLLVGDIARRERPDQHAGQQVADQHRQLQPVGDGAEDKGQAQARDDGGDQRGVVQRLSLTFSFFGRTQPIWVMKPRYSRCRTQKFFYRPNAGPHAG